MALPPSFVRPEMEELCRTIEEDRSCKNFIFRPNHEIVLPNFAGPRQQPPLTSAEMDRFLRAWRENSIVEDIFFSSECFPDEHDGLGQEADNAVGRFLTNFFAHPHPSIECVTLILTVEQLGMIDFASIKAPPSLKELDFACSTIGDRGVSLLAERLLKDSNWPVEKLKLHSMVGLSVVGCQAIASVLNQSGLKELGLDGNTEIGSAGIAAIACGLYNNKSLNVLFLGDMDLGRIGCESLLRAIPFSCLIKLVLHRNGIGDTGALAIADMISKSKTLEHLDVSYDDITCVGGVAIAAALNKSKLRHLDLHYNEIGDEGAEAFAKALPDNGVLQTLNLENNNIRVRGGVAIAKAMRRNSAIVEIDLEDNDIGDHAVDEFTCMLHINYGVVVQLDETGASGDNLRRNWEIASSNKSLLRLFKDNVKDKDIERGVVPYVLELFADRPGLLFAALKSTVTAWCGLAGIEGEETDIYE